MRKERFHVAISAVAILALIVLGVILWRSNATTSSGGSPAAPVSATSFTLPALSGSGEVTLKSFAGKPTVVGLFASWCTACHGELPGMAQIAKQLDGRVNFVGVDSQDFGDGVAAARDDGIAGWPLAKDVGPGNSSYHDALGASGMPATAFYDSAGQLLYVAPNALTTTELQHLLRHYFGINVSAS